MRRVGWHRAGPARALWLGALLIAVTALGGPPAAAAPTSRDTLRRAPIELRLPADIIYARAPGDTGAVVFRHGTHVALEGDRCTGCHPRPFTMLRRGPVPRHAAMDAGGSCGSCHDGRRAFGVRDSVACRTCHAGVARDAAASGARAASGAPRVPAPHVFPRGGDSPGPVTFRHDRHLRGAKGCADCHPKPFRMAAAAPLRAGGMHEAAGCGACHDGRRAFDAADPEACGRCHAGAGGTP